MKVAFFSNFINHHQVPFSDEVYKLTNGNFSFVEAYPLTESAKQSGYADFSYKPYVIQAWFNEIEKEKATKICDEADVVLFNPVYGLEYGIRATKKGKICFEVGERWLKRGVINILSPRLLKDLWFYHTLFSKRKVYRLCCSAFAAADQYKLLAYKNRCYKWGYFTEVSDLDIESVVSSRDSGQIRIMWCARFLDWKHPELPVKMAAKLKGKYNFVINMFGVGVNYEYIKELVNELGVNDYIKIHGSLANAEILKIMREHDIFLFTSDKNEGWGAVANEAMSNGCIIVGSDMIGSIPFLVKDGENGCIFKSEDVESLTEKVEWLINNPEDRKRLAINGYHTMKNLWSPTNAAKNLLQLIDDIKEGHDTTIQEGPCSKALPI